MKHLILTFIASLLILCLHAQKWQHIIGYPGTLEEGRELIEHYDNGYLITSIRSYGGENNHGWLVKTDINGEVLWDKQISVSPDIVLIDKTLYDEDGNIYIFGLIEQDTEYNWPLLVKLNACGEKEWCKNLYNPDFYYGFFKDAMLLDNGDLLGLAYFPDETQYDIIFLFCLSPDGEYKWKKSYASKANYPDFAQRTGNSIEKFGDTYIISGYVYSPYPGNPNHAYLRPMFIGIDEEFKEKWVIEFGINDSLLGKAEGAIAINDTLFMGVGRHRFVENGTEDQQSWLMFFDAKGNERGYKLLSDSQFGPEIKESVVFDIERIDEVKFMAAGGFMTVDEDLPWGEMIIDTAGNVYDYAIRENSGGGGHIWSKLLMINTPLQAATKHPIPTSTLCFTKSTKTWSRIPFTPETTPMTACVKAPSNRE